MILDGLKLLTGFLQRLDKKACAGICPGVCPFVSLSMFGGYIFDC